MDRLYPEVFSHPANFTGIAWFKASVFTRPPLMPVDKAKIEFSTYEKR